MHSIKSMLTNGVNPYEVTLTKKAKGKVKRTAKATVKSVVTNTIRKAKRVFIESVTEVPVSYNPTCMSCGRNISTITATYGRVIVDMLKKVIEGLKLVNNQIVEYKTVIHFPKYQTGYVCKSCFDVLYAVKYYDKDNNLKHGIELLVRPENKTTETVNGVKHVVPEARGNDRKGYEGPSGKEQLKSVSVVVSETDDEVVEHKVSRSSLKKDLPEPEPVDAKAYLRVTGSRGGRRDYEERLIGRIRA